MSVQVISNKDLWDDFIEKSHYGLLCHKWDFLKIMEKYSGMELLPYGIYRGEELIALFPLFFRQKGGIKVLYSPPMIVTTYIPYLGFIMSGTYDGLKQHGKERYLEIVANAISDEIKRLRPNFTSIATPPRFLDVRSFLWAGYSVKPLYNYITDLEQSEELLWNSFDKGLKKRIRSLEPIAGTMEIKAASDPDTLFATMQEKLARHGNTFWHCQSPDYLKEILAAYPENVRMYQLYHGEELVSQKVQIEYKGRAIAWMGGISMKEGPYTEYMTWEMMKMAKARGFKTYENWGAEEKGLCSFKSKFNPTLECCQLLQKKDVFGELAGKAYYVALKTPLIKNLVYK